MSRSTAARTITIDDMGLLGHLLLALGIVEAHRQHFLEVVVVAPDDGLAERVLDLA